MSSKQSTCIVPQLILRFFPTPRQITKIFNKHETMDVPFETQRKKSEAAQFSGNLQLQNRTREEHAFASATTGHVVGHILKYCVAPAALTAPSTSRARRIPYNPQTNARLPATITTVNNTAARNWTTESLLQIVEPRSRLHGIQGGA